MEYLSIADGRQSRGLRLVLSAGVPGPWGEAAKAVLKARNVQYLPIAQLMMEENDDLRAWTGLRNAPISVLDDEPPVSGWLDLTILAERLGSGPSLLPASSADRARAIGLSSEICAPNGFGWYRRLLMFEARFGPGTLPPGTPAHLVDLCRDYGFTAAACAAAPQRIADILDELAAQLRRQHAAGSKYLVGDRLSLCDLHWACFSMMVAPLDEADAPMPEMVRQLYTDLPAVVAAALDPALIAHRDRIYERHIGLPLDY